MASSIIVAIMNFAERMSRLGTESAFEVLARAKALERLGKEIVHLEIGEPDFDTPAHIREAAKRALDDGATHYGPAAGLPELREAIAKDIAGTRNIPVAPEEIVVTPGAKPIMYFVITALVNPGDEVIYPNPGFPIYESLINFVGGVPVPIPLREESDFGFDMAAFEKAASKKTRLIVINSPQNPTGGVLGVDQLGRIAEIAVKYQIPVLTDEVYKAFLYEGEFASITRFPGMRDLAIILDGFSKSYAMTGWRMGYGVMPVPLAEHVARLMVNSNSCTASFTQWAGIAALQGDQMPVRQMVAEFKRRRDIIVAGLNALPGVSCRTPKGAFYVFPNIKALKRPSGEVAEVMLQEAGVAVLGGTAFGEHGEGYLRLSYANSEANIRKALDRMRPVLARLAG
jgi:aspartate/methionine/tyrosine aminotransferase